MKISQNTFAEWFLRVALSSGFLSASADRLGMWPNEVSAWGNWQNFENYTKSLLPLVPEGLVPLLAYTATGLEIALGILLLIKFETSLVAKVSSALLLLFSLAMTFSKGIKVPLDYSVFTGSAAAFALSVLVQAKVRKSSE